MDVHPMLAAMGDFTISGDFIIISSIPYGDGSRFFVANINP
jgi:hypothetical protein